jgi:hypothetical protein
MVCELLSENLYSDRYGLGLEILRRNGARKKWQQTD